MPRVKKVIDATDHQIGQPGVAKMASTGPAVLEHASVEQVDGPKSKEFLDELAFNEEKVVVMVHESTDKNAEAVVFTAVNGRTQYFPRGMEVTCARKFVERLARAKRDAFGCVEYVDESGSRAFKYPKSTALAYPFSVLRDDNKNGAAWLKKILREA